MACLGACFGKPSRIEENLVRPPVPPTKSISLSADVNHGGQAVPPAKSVQHSAAQWNYLAQAQTQTTPPVVLLLQRQLAALQGTWISRVDTALRLTMESTGALAVSLTVLSQTHDCLVVLARRGPQDLALPPGSCISISRPGESAQSLDNPDQHSLECMYSSAAAVVRSLPSRKAGQATPPQRMASLQRAASGHTGTADGASVTANETLPLDWAHLYATAGITHFAALPLYHGTTLAGALTILGGPSNCPAALAVAAASAARGDAATGKDGGTAAGGAAPTEEGAAAGAVGSGGPGGGGTDQGRVPAPLEALFSAPLSLELIAMAVAQCCLGADMALARHAVEMVQAMHACASIQQLVAAMSLGMQALMKARFCLTLRCNVALAVEFQPNAIMFEEVHGAGGNSGSAVVASAMTPAEVAALSKPGNTGRTSSTYASSGQPQGARHDVAARMLSGGLAGQGGFGTMRSGIDTGDQMVPGASSGQHTTSLLLSQIVSRRYKARPFSVYHTLLIRTIHELASSAYGGTVVAHCHDHMQDAKTPSRDIYALGRGVGQPPQSLVLSVTNVRPADGIPDISSTLGATPTGNDSNGAGHSLNGFTPIAPRRSGLAASPQPAAAANRSRSATEVGATNGAVAVSAAVTSGHDHSGLLLGPQSGAHAVDGGGSGEPRTYIGLYVTSAEPLPSALLELILVELHSLACYMLSPLVHRKLLVGELQVEWSLMQVVTSSNLPHGNSMSDGSSATAARFLNRQNTSSHLGPAGDSRASPLPAAAHGVGRGVSIDIQGAPAAADAPVLGEAASPLPPGGKAAGGSLGPSAPNSRLSSLQRIMQPFLMADMATPDHTTTTTHGGMSASAGPAMGRHSGDAVGLPGASEGQAGAVAGGTPVGISRILAFDKQAAGGTSTGKATSARGHRPNSITASEGVARETLLAAAQSQLTAGAAGGSMQGGPAALSTEVANVQDTHSQMGLLVTSYKETLHNMHMELSVGATQRQSMDLHADDPGRLVLREVLGKGGHGVVFRGTMHTLEVAIKVFQTPGEDEPLAAGTASRPEVLAETLLQRRRVLTRAALELAIMSSISHPNIVQVYAQWPTALLERDETQPCRRRLRKLPPDTPPPTSGGLVCAVMVMEYCDKGTLVDAINRGDFVAPVRDGSGFKPNYKAIYTTLLEVALGLRHLANMAVTHCDVKPANILLRSSPRDPRGFTCKLADFGYAALLKDSSPDGHRSVVTDEACGTVTHMAPEMFVEGEPVDSSADVYAFGILMWELISGKQPYHDRNLKQLPHEVVNKGLRPIFPPNTPEVYKSLAKSCWSPLPRNRPTAAHVVQTLQTQLDKIDAVARLLGKV